MFECTDVDFISYCKGEKSTPFPSRKRISEFDVFIHEATRLAHRLQDAGRLLEFVVFPGQRHGSNINPQLKCHQMGMDAWKLATKEYLHEYYTDSQL